MLREPRVGAGEGHSKDCSTPGAIRCGDSPPVQIDDCPDDG
jgi:hypothetical protein